MNYSKEDVLMFVKEEGVKFIRIAFCDVFGKQKNISIMPEELPRAFDYGISFDASSVIGFGDEAQCDLLLHPDPGTLMLLPWRPEHGKVVRMYSTISYPDGTPFECDTRALLKKAVADAKEAGLSFTFGAEQEFYLFTLDENGNPTKNPYDKAGYMDIAPEDKGENIRREVCLTLEQMGIQPESSHHEAGPGQNEIDYRYSDPLEAADTAMTFQTVVKTVARRNGLYADFSAKPLKNQAGNGFHINMSVKSDNITELFDKMIAGILEKSSEMTLFMNPTDNSYERLGENKAPGYVSWSKENRSQLIRIPAADGEYRRVEYRAPDPMANPYLAFSLMIYAGILGIKNNMVLPEAADVNLFTAPPEVLENYKRLPLSFRAACEIAVCSDFIKAYIPEKITKTYCKK